MITGYDAGEAVFGERVVGMVRVVDTGSTPSCVGSIRRVGESLLHFTPLDPSMAPSSHVVDTAWDDAQSSSPNVDLFSRALPSALGVATGLSSSLVVYQADPMMPTRGTLFDDTASKCLGLQLLEALVDETSRRRLPVYLSFFTISRSGAAEVVHDILKSDPDSVNPVRLQVAPSLKSGTLFRSIREINVSRERRCAEVVFGALRVVSRFKQNSCIARDATVVAMASVPSGGATGQMSGLSLMDISGIGAAERSLCLSPAVAIDPYLGADVRSLVAYGLGKSSRLLTVGCARASATVQDMRVLKVADSIRCAFTTPVSVESRLREARCIPAQLFDADTGEILDPEECELYLTRRELTNHREQLNRIDQQASEQRVLFEQLQQDFGSLKDQLQRTEEHIVAALPEAIPAIQSDNNAAKVLKARFEAIREMEVLQDAERRRLAVWQKQLLECPVVVEQGLTRLTEESRVRLLEDAVESLSHENRRLRALFQKDIKVLTVELEAARSQIHPVAGKGARSGGLNASPLQPLLESFSEECSLLFKAVELARGHHDRGDGRSPKRQLLQLIDQLSNELRYNAEMLLAEGSGHSSEATLLSSNMSNEALFVRAALDRTRRALGIAMAPPTRRSAFETPSFEYWRGLVEERAVCRSERWALHNVSKGMALTAMRLVDGLGRVGQAIHRLTALLPPSHSVSGRNPTYGVTNARPYNGVVSTDQEELNRLLGEEMGVKRQSDIRVDEFVEVMREAHSEWVALSLQVQRCTDLAHLLQGSQQSATAEEDEVAFTPLLFDVAERGGGSHTEVGAIIDGTSPGVANKFTATEKSQDRGAAPQVVQTSLDEIVKGTFRRHTRGVSSSRSGPLKVAGAARKKLSQGYFSDESHLRH